MTTIEKKILAAVDKHLPVLLMIGCTILGILVRMALRDFRSADFEDSLSPWYDAIAANGLSQQVGDYNFMYQFVIWLLTKIGAAPLYSYKMISCIFDLVLAITAAMIVHRENNKENNWAAALAYGAVWLSPIVFLNSSAWAQCDAIYSAFALLAIFMLDKEKTNWSMCLLGIGFAFKLHTVFVLPLFLFVYFMRRTFSIVRFSLIPVSMLALSLPLVFWGRNIGEVFTIYANQTNSYQAMSMNYPSVWLLLCQAQDPAQYAFLKLPAIVMTVFVLALLMIWWIRKSYQPSGMNYYMMAFLVVYTCVLFLPSMHERYGYLYEILAVVLAVLIPKTIPLCIGLVCISLSTYGVYLFGVGENWLVLVCANLALYGTYVNCLTKEMQSSIHNRGKCAKY